MSQYNSPSHGKNNSALNLLNQDLISPHMPFSIILGALFFSLNLLIQDRLAPLSLQIASYTPLLGVIGLLLSGISIFLIPLLTFFIISYFVTKNFWKNLTIFLLGNILYFLISFSLISGTAYYEHIITDFSNINTLINLYSIAYSLQGKIIPSAIGYVLGIHFLKEGFKKRKAYGKRVKGVVKAILLSYFIFGILIFLPPFVKKIYESRPVSSPPGKGQFLYIGFGEGKINSTGKVLIYNLKANKKVKTITLGPGGTKIIKSDDNKFIYALNSNTGNFACKLMKIDTRTHSPVKTIPIGSIMKSYPGEPFLSGNYLYVPSYGGFVNSKEKVARINPETLEVDKIIEIPIQENADMWSGLAVSSDSRYLFYVYRSEEEKITKLVKLDIETNKIINEVKINYSASGIEMPKEKEFLDALEEINREKIEKIDENIFVGQEFLYKYIGYDENKDSRDDLLYILDKENNEILEKISLPKYSGVVQVIEIIDN